MSISSTEHFKRRKRIATLLKRYKGWDWDTSNMYLSILREAHLQAIENRLRNAIYIRDVSGLIEPDINKVVGVVESNGNGKKHVL